MGLPSWRQVFDKVERAVGAPIEDAVASPKYGKAVSLWVNYPKSVKRAVGRKVDGGLGGVLHALNVPTHSDVQRISRQLAALTGEIRSLGVPADRISAYVEQLQARETTPEVDSGGEPPEPSEPPEPPRPARARSTRAASPGTGHGS